jgi:hypothetical protein
MPRRKHRRDAFYDTLGNTSPPRGITPMGGDGMRIWTSTLVTVVALGLSACTQHEVNSNAREVGRETKEAGQELKQGSKSVARETGKAAHEVADETKEAAQKVGHGLKKAGKELKEGWNEAAAGDTRSRTADPKK